MVTVMSPEGKPIQVNANALNRAASEGLSGMIPFKIKYKDECRSRIESKRGYKIA